MVVVCSLFPFSLVCKGKKKKSPAHPRLLSLGSYVLYNCREHSCHRSTTHGKGSCHTYKRSANRLAEKEKKRGKKLSPARKQGGGGNKRGKQTIFIFTQAGVVIRQSALVITWVFPLSWRPKWDMAFPALSTTCSSRKWADTLRVRETTASLSLLRGRRRRPSTCIFMKRAV